MIERIIQNDGVFPNNAELPLTISASVFPSSVKPSDFERLFANNGWPPAWRSGIFDFNHYHSTAHEVLGCFSGSATLQFGGAANERFEIRAGDAVIIPAGVAHRCVQASQFVCVGAYPAGQRWNTCYGDPSERPTADRQIASLGPWINNPLANEQGD